MAFLLKGIGIAAPSLGLYAGIPVWLGAVVVSAASYGIYKACRAIVGTIFKGAFTR